MVIIIKFRFAHGKYKVLSKINRANRENLRTTPLDISTTKPSFLGFLCRYRVAKSYQLPCLQSTSHPKELFQWGDGMLSKTPIDLGKMGKEMLDMEILRVAIIAELDAINLYEELSAQTKDEGIKKVLLDIAREEKTHAGEFQTLLLRLDKEQVEELDKARKEVEELTDK